SRPETADAAGRSLRRARRCRPSASACRCAAGRVPPRARRSPTKFSSARQLTLGPGLERRDGRKSLAFEELEERAAARRDVGNAVLQAELGDRGERVAAA